MQQQPMQPPMEQPMQPGQAPAEGGGEENQLTELLSNIHMGMGMLTEILSEAQPELGSQAAQVLSQFEGLVETMSGGGAGPQPADAGVVPMEAGSQGVPMQPGMR
jgi:hypothetical protein